MITAKPSESPAAGAPAVLPKLPVTVDTKGRVRVSKEQRREILAALTRSGESVPRFAQRTGLKYSTLARWVQVSRRTQRPKQPPQLRLLEAVVASAPHGPGLQIQLPGGARVELQTNAQIPLVVALVRGLEKSC
jgi:transposase-like protein